jgi:hypothetical protein
MADDFEDKIDVLRKKLQDLEKKAQEKAALAAAKKAAKKAVKKTTKRPSVTGPIDIGKNQKDLKRIMSKLSRLEKRKKATITPSVTFQQSINKLNGNIEQLFELLSQNHEQTAHEAEILAKLATVLNQNEKIAQGILAIADMIKEHTETSKDDAVEKTADDNYFQDERPPQRPQTYVPTELPPPSLDMGPEAPPGMPDQFDFPEAPPLPTEQGFLDPGQGMADVPDFQDGKSKIFSQPPDDSIKPIQQLPTDSFWNQPPPMPSFSPPKGPASMPPPQQQMRQPLSPPSMNAPIPAQQMPPSGWPLHPPADQVRPIQSFSAPQPPGRMRLRPFDANEQK